MKSWSPKHHKYWEDCIAVLAEKLSQVGQNPPAITEAASDSTEVKAEEPKTITKPSVEAVVEQVAEAVIETAAEASVEAEPVAEAEPNIEAKVESTDGADATIEPSSETIFEEIEAIGRSPEPEADSQTEAPDEAVEEVTRQPDEFIAPKAAIDAKTPAATYFSTLPWSDSDKNVSATSRIHVNTEGHTSHSRIARLPPKEKTISNMTNSFFRQVPWEGNDEIERVYVQAAHTDLGQDPRSGEFDGANLLTAGLMSAARTSDRLSSRKESNTHSLNDLTNTYFAAIPWSAKVLNN